MILLSRDVISLAVADEERGGKYGINPIELSPEELALLHSDNERISIKEFKKGLRIMYRIVEGFCIGLAAGN